MSLLRTDLAHFLEHTSQIDPMLKGKRVLITGGTGFFGMWLTECFLHLDREHQLGATLAILTRDPARFAQQAPHLAQQAALLLVQGDIRSFAFPAGHWDYVIHAATDSVIAPGTSADTEYEVIVEGTRRVLDFCAHAKTERLLYVSSGAVYGPQPRDVLHITEAAPFAPDESPYTQGKRTAERLCLEHPDPALTCVLARCFAFLGPHLPLRAHFAAGNFLADALEGRAIEIQGDGTPLRSYLYMADLAIWLWTILLRGAPSTAYNIGSEEAVSIRELAERMVAALKPGLPMHVRGEPPPKGAAPARYVPSTRRAREDLGLTASIGLDEAIRRTAEWHWLQHS